MNINEIRKLADKDGILNITSDQAPAVREAITKYVKRFQKRFDAGEVTSKEIRKVIGFNTNLMYIDGEKAGIQKVSQVLRGKVKNVSFGGSQYVRNLQLELQTPDSPIVTKAKAGSDIRKKSGALLAGQEDHHVRFRTLFDPFYRHLSQADQIKLTKFLLSEGFAIGNTVENLVGIDKDLHAKMNNSEAIHKWAIDNNIQVNKAAPGKTNFVRNKKTGRIDIVKGGAEGVSGSALKAQMPNLDHITNVNEMQFLLGQYVELINEPLEDYTARTMYKQDVRRYGEGSPQVRSIESIKQNFANERDRIKAEFKLIHGDDDKYFHKDGTRKYSTADILDRKSWHLPFLKGSLLLEGGRRVLNTGKSIAGTIGPEDLLDENVTVNFAQWQTRVEKGDNPWVAAKEEGTDALIGLKDQLLTTGGVITGLKGLSMASPGAATTAGGALGIAGIPLMAFGAWRGIDAYLKERGHRTLTDRVREDVAPVVQAAHEGEALTAMPNERSLGSFLHDPNRFTAPGTVEVEEEDDKGKKIIKTYDQIQLPLA